MRRERSDADTWFKPLYSPTGKQLADNLSQVFLLPVIQDILGSSPTHPGQE